MKQTTGGIEKSHSSENSLMTRINSYRRRGPRKGTGMLIEALGAEGIKGMTLLDIGGGIGAIQHELLSAGVSSATNVEASLAYMGAAKEEAQRRGHGDQYRRNGDAGVIATHLVDLSSGSFECSF